jgi:hypothetical protein
MAEDARQGSEHFRQLRMTGGVLALEAAQNTVPALNAPTPG